MTAACAHQRIDGLVFEVSGAPELPTLVFGNSLYCTTDMWRQTAAAMAQRFRVVRWDWRGHGRSASNETSCCITDLAEALASALDILGIDRMIYVGSSIGGMLGMALASQCPDRLRGLVLCNSTPWVAEKDKWDARIAQARTAGLHSLARGTMDRWMPASFQAERPYEHSTLIEAATQVHPGSYVTLCEAVRNADLRAACTAIRTPTQVIGSSLDVMPLDEAEKLAGMIPDARLRVLPDSGHLPSVDDPVGFVQTLSSFLDACPKD